MKTGCPPQALSPQAAVLVPQYFGRIVFESADARNLPFDA